MPFGVKEHVYCEPTTIIAGIGLAIGAGSAVEQRKKANEAADVQEKSEKAQQKIRDLQSARQRRAAIRQARSERAQAVTAGVQQGVAGSSSLATGVGNIQTQLGGAVGFLDQTQALSSQASIFNIKAAKLQSKAATFGAVSGLGMSIFSNAESIGTGITKLGNPKKFFS